MACSPTQLPPGVVVHSCDATGVCFGSCYSDFSIYGRIRCGVSSSWQTRVPLCGIRIEITNVEALASVFDPVLVQWEMQELIPTGGYFRLLHESVDKFGVNSTTLLPGTKSLSCMSSAMNPDRLTRFTVVMLNAQGEEVGRSQPWTICSSSNPFFHLSFSFPSL